MDDNTAGAPAPNLPADGFEWFDEPQGGGTWLYDPDRKQVRLLDPPTAPPAPQAESND